MARRGSIKVKPEEVKLVFRKTGKPILISPDPHPLSSPVYRVKKISAPSPELETRIKIAQIEG